MPNTPLHDALVAAGASFGEFGGARTAASFGDVAREFQALRAGAAVYDLGRRAKLRATGNDRVRWLNGMVTNNVRDLEEHRGNYNFLLNAQGHILGDLYAYNRDDHFLVDTDLAQAPRLLELFEKFIIMDEVEVADISDKLTAVGISGPKAEEVLSTLGLGIPVGPLAIASVPWQDAGASLVRKDNPARDEFEIWLPPAEIAGMWNGLVGAGATPVGYEALELVRVADGVPRFGQDIREKDLPQETGQQRALDFNKGCYLGQEIVERIHARGAVHRTLAGFDLGESTPAPGAAVSAAGKEVGQLTSVAPLPNASRRTLALGYVRREAAKPGTEVEIAGATVRVAALPFMKQESPERND
jgi:folate-binding protein YgfZ